MTLDSSKNSEVKTQSPNKIKLSKQPKKKTTINVEKGGRGYYSQNLSNLSKYIKP